MTDQEIIHSIRKGNNEKPIKKLYKEFPKVKALILKEGGSAETAQEIFNDSLVILIEKVRQPEFQLTSQLTTFLYGINRFLLKNELRKQNKHVELEWRDTLILTDQDLGYDEEKEAKLNTMEKILNMISEKCKELLRLFYFQKMSMTEIAEKLNFSSLNSAKTQKYKCIERASQLAQEMQQS
ncbi:MAG: sigma-70 family RNA polymerase sigma factor [Flavobacteriales bacterium]|nr:sigma-70 family RNA polymerase sigma factor [Flavobacteriales bacterium]